METPVVEYDKDKEIIEIDTGLHYLQLPKDEALSVAKIIIEKITRENLAELRKDFKYEGSSI